MRLVAALVLLCLVGCDNTDPYLRQGVWRPNHANEADLRAMVVVPSDLVIGTPPAAGDGVQAAAAVSRLRHDRVRPLLDSGVAQMTPSGGGSAAPAPAPPVSATGQ